MGGEVCRTIEDFLTLRTPVLNVHNHRASEQNNFRNKFFLPWNSPVLRQAKGIIVNLFTQSTDVISNLVFYLCQLLFGFFRHLDHIELRVYVTCNTR